MIDLNMWQEDSIISISHLKDIEFRLIYEMYNSEESFNKIIAKLDHDDFTFIVNKKIFEFLKFHLKENNIFGDNSKKLQVALDIKDVYKVSAMTTINILNGRTIHCNNLQDFIKEIKIENIDLDIFEISDFSNKRQKLINTDDNRKFANFEIEDEYGKYFVSYENGLIHEIGTTYIFTTPEELCDTYKYTFENINTYINKDNNEVTAIIDEDNVSGVNKLHSFRLRKNIDRINKVNTLIKWADENNIDDVKLPRNRGRLFSYDIMEDFNDCNLINVPQELFEIKKNSFSLNFINNKIKTIPNGISSCECNSLMLCNNEIDKFPKSVYELKNLATLCLHGNNLDSLPDDIYKLKNMRKLSISNNSINTLPSSFSKINLEELDIENTNLDEISLSHINLEKLEKISFNDSLLPWFLKNIDKLTMIDTINLVHSNYKEGDEIFSSFDLKNTYDSWLEKDDSKGRGYIVLSKFDEKE